MLTCILSTRRSCNEEKRDAALAPGEGGHAREHPSLDKWRWIGAARGIELVRLCRKWARAVAGSTSAVFACGYLYVLRQRQLNYADTAHEIMLNIRPE
jgi:hypothetical protein